MTNDRSGMTFTFECEDDEEDSTSSGLGSGGPGSSHELSNRKLNEYMFKIVRYRHMDLELAKFLMIKSLVSPSQLY